MHYIHAKAREAQEQYIAELGIVPRRERPCGYSELAVNAQVL